MNGVKMLVKTNGLPYRLSIVCAHAYEAVEFYVTITQGHIVDKSGEWVELELPFTNIRSQYDISNSLENAYKLLSISFGVYIDEQKRQETVDFQLKKFEFVEDERFEGLSLRYLESVFVRPQEDYYKATFVDNGAHTTKLPNLK